MIKIEATGQIIAMLRNGEFIAFEDRAEYDEWMGDELNSKQVNSLYGDGKILYESIQEGKNLMAHLQELDQDVLEEAGIDIDLII